MNPPIAVAVYGAAGRMGQALLRAVHERSDVHLAAALVREGSAFAGKALAQTLGDAAPELHYSAALDAAIEGGVLIDFSGARGFDAALALALERQLAFVSGSTGLAPSQLAALDAAAAMIPVLWSANFSLGVALLTRLVRDAARALPEWDCEIIEAHHSRKLDAPSGTALALGRAAAAAREQDFDAVAALVRTGDHAARSAGQIGFAAVRAGDIVGEHTVLLATAGERIELTHRATDRAIFARGAVAAARWLAGRPTGRYTLDDVLFS
jgi:4-hydroxy-tetrahydrodipicolinate reductase